MNQMIKNLSWLSLANAAVKPIWFVFITYVCLRFLGVGGFGEMTAVLALVGISDGSLMLGTTPVTVREIARDRSLAGSFLTNFLPLRFVLSAVAIALSIGVAAVIDPSMKPTAIVAAGAYVLTRNLAEYGRAVFKGLQDFKLDAWSTVAEKLLVSIGGTVLLVMQPTVTSVFIGMTLGMVATIGLNLRWSALREVLLTKSARSGAFLRKHFRTALPLGLSSIFALLLYRTDSIMLKSMVGDLPTGQYGLAFRITEAALLLPALLTTVLLPRLSEIGTEERIRFWKTAGTGLAAMGAIASVVAGAVTLMAPGIVHLIDPSPEAAPAAPLLQWLIWTFPLSSLNFLFVTVFTAANALRRIAWILGAAALLNISLNLWLIPIHAAWGATTATLVTQGFILLSFAGSQMVRRV